MKGFILTLLIALIVMLLIEGILFDEIQKYKQMWLEEVKKNSKLKGKLEEQYNSGWSDGFNERM